MIKKKTRALATNTSKINSLNSSGFQAYSFCQFQKSVNKSLVDATHLEMIQLSHEEINFINTDPNQIYEITLSIRNVSNKYTSIKYTKPKSEFLSIAPSSESYKKHQQNLNNGNPKQTNSKTSQLNAKKQSMLCIAPGLEIKLVISYNSQVNEIIRDKVMIYTDGGEYEQELPINVFPIVNYLGFDGLIDFGVVKPGSEKQMIIDIENKGKNIAQVTLKPSIKGSNKAKIKIFPENFTLQPQCRQKISVAISSPEIGQVQGIIDILPHYVTESYIEFCGIFCDSNRFIAGMEGEEVSQICLPPMFAGQQSNLAIFLVNNTPKRCEYRLIRKKTAPLQNNCHSDGSSGSKIDEQENMCLITPEQFGRDDQYDEKIIKFTPFEGELEGYSKKQINCQVAAKFEENDYQLFCNYTAGKIKILPYESTDWSYVIKTYFSDDDPPKTLTIKGQSLIPKLSLSSVYFNFGDVGVRKKYEKSLRIDNLSSKQVHIKLERTNNYKFSCQRLIIPENGFKTINVAFTPQVCGELHEICKIKVGEFSFPIKMIGKGLFVGAQSRAGNKKMLQSKNKNQTLITQSQQDSKAVEMDLEEMDFPPEISVINEKSYILDDTQNKSISFNYDASALKLKFGKPEKLTEKPKKTIKNRNGKDTLIDTNNFNENEEVEEYPGPGKNQQEDRVISRELTLQQFRNISVGPVIIDFGEVFVETPQKKTFHICNFNSKPISVQLDIKNQPQFQESLKTTQVLPNQSHGGIGIVFRAFKEGLFKFPLQYILNGRHYFQILATGIAILPTVKLSKADFKFIANEEDPSFDKREELVLKNVYPYQVNFQFTQEKDSYFKVTPQSGRIAPNNKKQVTIFHSFEGILQGGGRIEENVRLKIKNGQKFDIKCTSIVPDAQLTCKPGQLNFKEISICKYHEMKFSIRNPSKNFTIFKVVPNKDIEDLLSIQANCTSLGPDEVAEVNVKLYYSKEDLIDSGVTVVVRGGKSIFIPLKANIIIPKVKVQGDSIDFGSMPVSGNPNIKQITLINDSPISTELDLVLQNDSYLSRCLSIKEESNQFVTVLPPQQTKQYKVKIFPIKLAKKCKAQISLQFVPEEVKQYNFMLPLYLSGSPDIFGSLQKNVRCLSESDRLIIDHRVIDFGKIIIEQSIEHIPKSFLISLKNPCEEEIEWWINEGALEPFQLQKKSGTLKGLEQIKLKVFLYNDNAGTFKRQLQFFINKTNLQPTKPYLKIIVLASANYPQLYFNRPYVLMPVVRVGEQSNANFEIINGGYENLHLKHIICQESSLLNFQVKYLSGSNLSITKKSLLIGLTFKSDKPISFTYKIDFYDHHNRVFSIFVSGTADNSLYTIPEAEWLNGFETEIEADCVFLKNYLNCLGFVDEPLYDFPDSLADSDFQGLQKLLTYENPGFQKFQKMRFGTNISSLNTNGNIALGTKKVVANYALTTLQAHEYLSEIIKLLKSEGAYLSQIRPEFLMKQNEFLEIISSKTENPRIMKYYNLPTSDYFTLQRKKSWIILVYQIFKVCSKVPIKKKNGDFWSQFPARERTIIQWLEQCYQSEARIDEVRCSNELKDLGDGEMLSALIMKYTNIKVTEVYGKNNLSYKEKQKKCKKIIDTFNQIGIASGVKVEDLLKSKPRQMLVFLSRLYMILPSYLQKGEPIVFSCALGQTLTKSIQIKNPSKYPVTYMAKIQGSKAYVIQSEEQFTIEGKKKHQISIKYISNIDIDKVNGTLTITGKTSAKFTPSTFIFVLKSNSLGKISQKNIQVSAQLYDPFEFQINVKNSFAYDSNFSVTIMSATGKQSPKNLYCSMKTLKIKKGQTLPTLFTFFPFVLETHKYFILFRDPKVGQFQYEVVGLVEQPQLILQPIKIGQTFFTSKSYIIDIYVPQKNDLLVKARKIIEASFEKNYRKNLGVSSLNVSGRRSQQKIEQLTGLYPLLKQENYTVSLIPQNQMINLKHPTLTFDAEQQQSSSATRKLTLNINMKVPVKDGVLYLMLKNSSHTDVRRYKLIVNSVYKPLRYEMEIRVPVNQSIKQPLPLINVSNQNNTFSVSFNSASQISHGGMKSSTNSQSLSQFPTSSSIFQFTNDPQIILKPREQSTVTLTFSPKHQQQYTGLVKIQNLTTGQLLEYEVIGIGEQPLAQTIKLVQTTLEQKKYEIKLPFTKPQRFQVTKFSLENSSPYSNPSEIIKTVPNQELHRSKNQNFNLPKFDKSFFINNQSNSIFKFQFQSRKPGVYSGRLHIEQENRIHAFHVIISVEEALAGQIYINAIERQVQEKQIQLKAGTWKIEHNDPNIDIPEEIKLEKDGAVKFSYSSMKTGTFKHSYIIVRNDVVGHLKYLLNVKISEQPESVLDYGQVILGRQAQRIIELSNPDSYQMTIEGVCSNQNAFFYKQCTESTFQDFEQIIQPISKEEITCKVMKIPPNKSVQIKLIYRPSLLDQEQSGKIYFISNTNLKWKYQLKGRGCLTLCQEKKNLGKDDKKSDLEPFEVKEIEAEAYKQVFVSISFINPFKNIVQIHIFIENQEQFELVHENNKYTLGYLEQIQIPVRFQAKSIRKYTGIIKVLINQNVYWRYAINAHVYCYCFEQQKILKLPTRQKKELTLDFSLPSQDMTRKNDKQKYTCLIKPKTQKGEGKPQNNVGILNRSMKIVKEWVELDPESNEYRAFFTFNFLSYRPFIQPVLFQISQTDHSKWIYKGQIEFETPSIDDHFEIVTEINRSSTVGFRVSNRTKNHAKFIASFTSDSDMQFSIWPKNGQLEPYGREGTLMEVTFSPTQYKTSWHGKIIIETDDSYWSYFVKGSLPHYSPPIGKSVISTNSRIINK